MKRSVATSRAKIVLLGVSYWVANNRVFPSGDQSEAISPFEEKVICRAAPPLAGTAKMSQLPLRTDEKAIQRPSGEKRG